MKSWIKKIIQSCLKFLFKRKFKMLNIGSETNIFLWRIKTKHNNQLAVGDDCLIHSKIVFERDSAKINIGHRTFIGRGLLAIANSLNVGNDVMISWGVTIVDHNSHSIRFSERADDVKDWIKGVKNWSNVKVASINIEDKVWIGFNATILKGVTLGEGSIVGAGAVVTKSVPPWTIVAGNPAKIIREIPVDER